MRYLSLIAIFLLSVPTFSAAQILSSPSANEFYIELVPNDPTPGVEVTATLKSHFGSVNRYSIDWFTDERRAGSGPSTTFTTPVSGRSVALRAALSDADGTEIDVETTITPIDVQLFTEARGLVPPLYRGAREGSFGTSILAQAVVSLSDAKGALVPDSALFYSWSVSGKPFASGYGRSSIEIRNPGFSAAVPIRVLVESDGGARAERLTTHYQTEPILVLYEESPLFGTLYHAPFRPEVTSDKRELTITAFPYFAPSLRVNDPQFTYEWTVNERPVSAARKSPTIALGASSGEGKAKVGLLVTHDTQYLFQKQGLWNFSFLTGF